VLLLKTLLLLLYSFLEETEFIEGILVFIEGIKPQQWMWPSQR